MSPRRPTPLETVSVTVPHAAIAPFEAAILSVCATVALVLIDEAAEIWRVEGVKAIGENDATLAIGLALAQAATGAPAPLTRAPTEAEGWLARVYSGFPEQPIGRRLLIRGSHLPAAAAPGRHLLTLDAGLAFGSGEHGSTRGCLLALERLAHRRPCRVLDLGCGSGILALAAASLLHRHVTAVDNDPWSVRTAARNAAQNRLAGRVRARLGDGWRTTAAQGQWDLVFANILARPLCAMARDLARHLAPGGRAILSGFSPMQARAVLAAHRRAGLRLEHRFSDGAWTALVVRK